MRESSGLSLGYPVRLLIDRLRRPQVMVGVRAGKVAGRLPRGVHCTSVDFGFRAEVHTVLRV